MASSVFIYSDGSCDIETKVGGWGCILKYGNVEKEFSGSELNTTSQRMEIQGAIEALNHITRPVDIVAKSDSNYLIRGMREWHQAWITNWLNSQGKPVVNKDLWEKLIEYNNKYKIKWQWCPEGASEYILRCHDLAITAMKKRRVQIKSGNKLEW